MRLYAYIKTKHSSFNISAFTSVSRTQDLHFAYIVSTLFFQDIFFTKPELELKAVLPTYMLKTGKHHDLDQRRLEVLREKSRSRVSMPLGSISIQHWSSVYNIKYVHTFVFRWTEIDFESKI